MLPANIMPLPCSLKLLCSCLCSDIDHNTWGCQWDPRSFLNKATINSFHVLMGWTFKWPCIVINSYNKTNWMHLFLTFIFGIKIYMFRTVPLSIITSFSLYTQQWYMSYRFADSLRAGSGRNAVPSWSCSQALWHIPLLCLQWKTRDDGQRNCPKHVEFYSKNKFEK